MVTDWRTGLALHGMDPVAYFTDGRPVPGRPGVEETIAGVVWRFRHDGNRVAFAASPEAYLPRFAGYDPLALGRGVATAGNPTVWVIHEDRLHLFHTTESLTRFREDPAGIIAAAAARWPQLRAGLTVTGSVGAISTDAAGPAAPPDRPGQ